MRYERDDMAFGLRFVIWQAKFVAGLGNWMGERMQIPFLFWLSGSEYA
jgi:hypothetical protein